MLFLIGQPFYSLAIIQLHALSLLQKTVQIRDQLFLYTDPESMPAHCNYGVDHITNWLRIFPAACD